MLKYALDIGSAGLRFVAADYLNSELKIKGSLKSKVEGYSGGIITDYKKLFFSILKIIKDFEKEYDNKPKRVALNCSHPKSRFYHLRESFQRSISDKPISAKELDRFKSQILQDKISFEERDIFVQVEEYIIDGQKGIVDPEKMLARNVEIVLNVITIPVGFFNNILSIFSELGIELEAIIPEAVAKASLYLDLEAKRAGAMLLDIGWSKTKVAVFKDGILKNSIIFESGFDNIFKRIQEIYHLDDIEADKVLNEVMITEKESIMLQSEDGFKEVSVLKVRQIIDRGFKESLYSIKKSMDSKDISHLFAKGVFISGGSILQYPDLKDIATAILKQPVVIKGNRAFSLSSDYAAAAGMLNYLFEREASGNRDCSSSFFKRSFSRVYQFFDKYF